MLRWLVFGVAHLSTGHHLNISLTSPGPRTARHLHYSPPGLFMMLLALSKSGLLP